MAAGPCVHVCIGGLCAQDHECICTCSRGVHMWGSLHVAIHTHALHAQVRDYQPAELRLVSTAGPQDASYATKVYICPLEAHVEGPCTHHETQSRAWEESVLHSGPQGRVCQAGLHPEGCRCLGTFHRPAAPPGSPRSLGFPNLPPVTHLVIEDPMIQHPINHLPVSPSWPEHPPTTSMLRGLRVASWVAMLRNLRSKSQEVGWGPSSTVIYT